jgi:hypothetical protein
MANPQIKPYSSLQRLVPRLFLQATPNGFASNAKWSTDAFVRRQHAQREAENARMQFRLFFWCRKTLYC